MTTLLKLNRILSLRYVSSIAWNNIGTRSVHIKQLSKTISTGEPVVFQLFRKSLSTEASPKEDYHNIIKDTEKIVGTL